MEIKENLNGYELINFTGGLPSENENSGITNTRAIVKLGRPYLIYSGLFSQSGISAPTVTQIQNELGGLITRTYEDVGQYILNSVDGLFDGIVPETVTIAKNSFEELFLIRISKISKYQIRIRTYSFTGNLDDILSDDFIEIRVYPEL